jgi:hypothetical protein
MMEDADLHNISMCNIVKPGAKIMILIRVITEL